MPSTLATPSGETTCRLELDYLFDGMLRTQRGSRHASFAWRNNLVISTNISSDFTAPRPEALDNFGLAVCKQLAAFQLLIVIV
jgi:hypothetical protein